MVNTIVYKCAYPTQVDKIENVGTFAQKLDKRGREEFFEQRGFGKDAIKKQGYCNAKKVIVGDDTNRAF